MLATTMTKAKTEKMIENVIEKPPVPSLKIKKRERPKNARVKTTMMAETTIGATPFEVTL